MEHIVERTIAKYEDSTMEMEFVSMTALFLRMQRNENRPDLVFVSSRRTHVVISDAGAVAHCTAPRRVAAQELFAGVPVVLKVTNPCST